MSVSGQVLNDTNIRYNIGEKTMCLHHTSVNNGRQSVYNHYMMFVYPYNGAGLKLIPCFNKQIHKCSLCANMAYSAIYLKPTINYVIKLKAIINFPTRCLT